MIIQIEGTSPTSLFRIELIVEVVSRIGRDSRCRVHGIKEKAIEEKSGDVYIYMYIYIGKERSSGHRLFRIDVQLR